MDSNTLVIEVNERDMPAVALYRRKRQAVRAARAYKPEEADKNASGQKHASKVEAEAALAHTRRHGFKWCIAVKNHPVRRK